MCHIQVEEAPRALRSPAPPQDSLLSKGASFPTPVCKKALGIVGNLKRFRDLSRLHLLSVKSLPLLVKEVNNPVRKGASSAIDLW